MSLKPIIIAAAAVFMACSCAQQSGTVPALKVEGVSLYQEGSSEPVAWQEWNDWAAARNISLMTWSISDKNETCSMLTPEASSEGPWEDSVIKEWGRIVKEWL